jgi:hypothetical protein
MRCTHPTVMGGGGPSLGIGGSSREAMTQGCACSTIKVSAKLGS